MGTHHAHTASDDSQPALLEVGRPAGVAIGKRLWLVDGDGQRAVFLGGTAIHVYDVADRDAQRVCIASLSTAGPRSSAKSAGVVFAAGALWGRVGAETRG